VFRFHANAGLTPTAAQASAIAALWRDGFEDVAVDRLRAAFVACLRTHSYKNIPTVGDVRQHLLKAETNTSQFEAEQRWSRVREYLRLYYSADGIQIKRYIPDCPHRGCDCPSAAPRITPRSDHAIRAAGGLEWINECSLEDLQWAKKRFIEDYIVWGEMDKDQFLLPEGPIREQFSRLADMSTAPMLNSPSPYHRSER
jgi:hypothetical protein